MAAFAWAKEVTVGSLQHTAKGTHIYIKLRIRHSSFDLLLQLTGRQNESLGAINNIFVGICRLEFYEGFT